MKLKRKRIIFLFILLLIILYLLIYVLPRILGAFDKTVIAEHKPFQVKDEVEILMVRDETIYLANRSGVPNYYVGEGTVVRKGTQILTITGGKGAPEKEEIDNYKNEAKAFKGMAVKPDNYFTKSVGVVSYFIDKDSKIINIEDISSLREDDMSLFAYEGQNVCKAPDVQAVENEPLFKVVDHSKWYMVFWIDEGDIGNYRTGYSVDVKLAGTKVKAVIDKIREEDDRCKVILKCNESFLGFLSLRKAEATVITKDYQGLSVPNESIVTKGGKPGVYVKTKTGEFVFKRIMIITTNGEDTLIKEGAFFTKGNGKRVETVNVYDEILKNP